MAEIAPVLIAWVGLVLQIMGSFLLALDAFTRWWPTPVGTVSRAARALTDAARRLMRRRSGGITVSVPPAHLVLRSFAPEVDIRPGPSAPVEAKVEFLLEEVRRLHTQIVVGLEELPQGWQRDDQAVRTELNEKIAALGQRLDLELGRHIGLRITGLALLVAGIMSATLGSLLQA